MKIEVLTENLKKAVNICERLTRKNLTLPILQNVLIKAEGNFLELNTTNLETSILWLILAKIEKGGCLVVPATLLANLVNLTTDEKTELRGENNNLILTTENQKNQIQGQNIDDFPIIPKIKKENHWQLPTIDLVKGITQVVDIPSSSQIRPEISGLYFSLKKGKLKLVSTDSFRLSEKTINIKGEEQKEGSFILPQSTAKELLNILSQETLNQEEGKINVYFEPNHVLFEIINKEISHPKIQISSRLIEGEYPNYQEIIPKKYTTRLCVEKVGLENQIKKAGLFTGKILEVKLTLLPKEKKLKVFSQSPDIGKNESELSCQIDGEPLDVSFNYKFLLDGLNNIKSSEVALELSGEDGPAALRAVGDDSYLYILMPIKAN